MTSLRQRYIEDLQLRNRSPRTVQIYVFHVRAFAVFFKQSPDQLGADHVHRYLLHLLHEKKSSWSYYNQAVSALRFFYMVTCPSATVVTRLPYGKRPKRLPQVRSREEVARFLGGVRDVVICMVLRTIYGTGLRLGEALSLTPANIDSRLMVVRVVGKGNKERVIPLSPLLLTELRLYWRKIASRVASGPGVTQWLFSGKHKDRALHPVVVQRRCQRVCREQGLARITPHTLRHCYATHLLEAGTDTRTIQALLGHQRVGTTALYTHVTAAVLNRVASPLDTLPVTTTSASGQVTPN